MPKTLTAEQQAKSQERRERFSKLAKTVADMTPEQREALAGQMSATTIEGHPLSVGNACLAYCQRPGVTLIGGYGQWRQHGRQVRKGESGLMIWAPVGHRGESGKVDGEVSRFVPITVFDVSQTDEV